MSIIMLAAVVVAQMDPAKMHQVGPDMARAKLIDDQIQVEFELRIPGVESHEREETYEVLVPVTYEEDGVTKTKFRKETRTRIVTVAGKPTSYRTVKRKIPLEGAIAHTVGKLTLTGEEIEKRLAKQIPVLIVFENERIALAYRDLIRPATMILRIPARRESYFVTPVEAEETVAPEVAKPQ